MRRPRPTYRELDALRQELQYRGNEIETLTDANKVLRITLKDVQGRYDHSEEIITKVCDERDRAWSERDDAFQAIRALRPLTVGDLGRILWNGIRGRGWRRVQ